MPNSNSDDIPEHFSVDKDIYVELLFELYDYFEELQNEFKPNNEDLDKPHFSSRTKREFPIDYNYTAVIASDLNGTQSQVVWELKYLGILHKKTKMIENF